MIVTDAGNLCQKNYLVTVTVDEPLKGSITATLPQIYEGTSTTIDAGSYNAETYSWTSPAFDGVKQGSQITESPTQTTTYYVHMDRGACTATDYITIEVIPSTSVSDITNTPIKIYPNPFTNKLEIEKAANYNLTVTDMQGRIQYQRDNLTGDETVTTSGWTAGIYLINLSSQDDNIVRKVVKH